jgi:hypothetical protein
MTDNRAITHTFEQKARALKWVQGRGAHTPRWFNLGMLAPVVHGGLGICQGRPRRGSELMVRALVQPASSVSLTVRSSKAASRMRRTAADEEDNHSADAESFGTSTAKGALGGGEIAAVTDTYLLSACPLPFISISGCRPPLGWVLSKIALSLFEN